MTDREVIITHLDDLRLFADITVHPIVSPDNWDVYSSLCDYIDQIKTEVEILLKEQEPKMIEYHDNPLTGLPVAHCPNCMRYARQFDSSVEEETHFCPWCGQEVKWE